MQSGATIDPNMSMGTLKSTLDRIAQEGNIYLTHQATLSNEALKQAQGGGTSGATKGGNSIYSF